MNSPFNTPSLTTTYDRPVSNSLCLANAELVLPDQVLRGAITIEQGVISEITEGDHVPSGGLDCSGDLVVPGLVEEYWRRHLEQILSRILRRLGIGSSYDHQPAFS